ncbi:MAG: nickel-dependent lactate racemase [Actinomycetota bacterium]|nr:nickel-dependent lactate racemase [Actinomycetota bacterium]
MSYREFELSYGHQKIKFSIRDENLLGVIQAKKMSPLPNPRERVRESLRNPDNFPPLSEIIKPGGRIAILVSDRTRAAKSDLILSALLDELNSSGVPNEDIFITFATGTHHRHTREEQQQIVGEEVSEKVTLYDHVCNDRNNLKYVGTTSRGTRVELNRQVLEADRIILTGTIVYHYFAGFGGGRKSILPGIASFEAIQSNHRLVLNPGKGRNPLARTGILNGNSVHEDMVEAASMVNPDFLCNVVLNDDGELSGIFAGHWRRTHEKGCRFVDEHYRVKVSEKADLVVVSCGGHPMDVNFAQSHKAMDNASFILRDGGVMILLAECGEGYPSPEYRKWLKYRCKEEIEEVLRERFSIPGHTIYSAMEKAERFHIILVTELNPNDVHRLGLTPASSIEEALGIARAELGEAPSAYVMPRGYTTLGTVPT